MQQDAEQAFFLRESGWERYEEPFPFRHGRRTALPLPSEAGILPFQALKDVFGSESVSFTFSGAGGASSPLPAGSGPDMPS